MFELFQWVTDSHTLGRILQITGMYFKEENHVIQIFYLQGFGFINGGFGDEPNSM